VPVRGGAMVRAASAGRLTVSIFCGIAISWLLPGRSPGESQLQKMVEFNTTGIHRDFIMAAGHYEVDGNVMLFWDWRWVYPGYPAWNAPPGVRGGDMSPWSTDPMPGVPLVWGQGDIPVGLRLEAQRPALERRVEGDTKTFPQLQENGLFKAWSVIAIPAGALTNANLPPKAAALTYLESRNLKDWTGPPKHHVVHIAGFESATNIIAILPTMAHGTVSVFKDPSAPANERYKLIMVGTIDPEAEERYRQKWPKDIDRYAYRGKDIWGMLGALSPDGLRWNMLDVPLSIVQCDTPDMPTYYDPDLGKYVFYGRTRYGLRRANSRVETADFRHFPLPELTQFSGAELRPDWEWYSPSSVSRYPGTRQYHLMLPLMWRKNDDTFAVYMATSFDGRYWSVVPPGPILEPRPGPLGQPGACGYHARQSLLELPDGKLAVMVQGISMPHKYPYRPSHPPGGTYWATWPRDRLVALVADGKAEFRTPSVVFQDERILINCRTRQAGSIRVQVRSEGKVLRSFEECQPITGDFTDRVVTWRKNLKRIGHTPGTPVVIEFRLEMAELFSLRFQ
jgi:hypothetical protein